MEIVGALDVHRRQITTKTLELESGEVRYERISPVTRAEVRAWLERFHGREVEFALEGTTGWRFVVEEIEAAGLRAHLADPAETAASPTVRSPRRSSYREEAERWAPALGKSCFAPARGPLSSAAEKCTSFRSRKVHHRSLP